MKNHSAAPTLVLAAGVLLQGCAVTIEKEDVFTLRDQHQPVGEVPFDADQDRARLSELTLDVNGRRFLGYRYASPNPKRAVLFFPGNGYGAPAAVSRIARLFSDNQTDVYILSYGQPGETVPSVSLVFSMSAKLAEAAAATSGVSSSAVTAVGHSLGGWVALQLAGTTKIGCAIVAGSGTTASETAVHLVPKPINWLANFQPTADISLLNNLELAKRSTTPVLVVGSIADTVMPPDRSQRIFNQLPPDKGSELYVSVVSTHGGYFRDPEVTAKMTAFMRTKCGA